MSGEEERGHKVDVCDEGRRRMRFKSSQGAVKQDLKLASVHVPPKLVWRNRELSCAPHRIYLF